MKRVIALLITVVMIAATFCSTLSVFATENNNDTTATETSESTTASSSQESTVESNSEEAENTSFTTQETSTEPSESADASESSETTGTTEPSEETPSSGDSQTTESTSDTQVTESTETTEQTQVTEATEKPTEGKTKVSKPKAVKGFKVVERKDKKVKLKWRANNKNANRYYIYRAVEKMKTGEFKFKLYKELGKKKTTFTDRDVVTGRYYKYKIAAVKFNKKEKLIGKESKITVFIPLLATDKLEVKECTTTQIKLKWSKIKNATKYQVYRKEIGGEYKKIATTKNKDYVDKKVTSGKSYSYAVRGVRYYKGTEKRSPYTFVCAAAAEFGVKSVTVKSYLYRGLFTWEAVSGVNGYDIFYCQNDGKEKYVDTVTSASYLTERLTNGKTYTYNIKAFKNFGDEKVYGKSRLVKVKIVSTAYGKSAGKSYIEVCTTTQTVNMVVNGKQYISTPVVTGMYHCYDTTKGFHKIISKKSPATLVGSAGGSSWNVGVNYWLGFTWDGQGLHDSTWRTSGYGGSVYKTNGSHGCVNTPYTAMGKIYSKAYTGMPVIVY